MAEFKIIEQANEIADGDYILTVHDGEIMKVAKEDAKVGGGDGGSVLIPYYKFMNETIYEDYRDSAMRSSLYKIGNVNNTDYIIVKDSEWRKIKKGSPVYIILSNTPGGTIYCLANRVQLQSEMFSSMGSSEDYDGQQVSLASILYTPSYDGSSVDTMKVISATILKNYFNYEGAKPPYNTYEGGAEKALEVLTELGYFDVE